MDPLVLFSGVGVAVSAAWLVCLALFVVFETERATRFLGKFASSRRTHVFEQTIRIVAGLAFVGFAGEMRLSSLFQVFGWFLIASAGVLLVLPWRIHRRFAERTVPPVTRHPRLFGLASFLLGAAILFAMT